MSLPVFQSDGEPLASSSRVRETPVGDAGELVGARVGNYVIERPLARGGMGAVFVARHPALGREVAAKFLSRELNAFPELTARFLEEARLTAGLRHPNIVDIFDFGELDGRFYYVMELLRGQDLASWMRGRHFQASDLVPYVEQICAALDAAHGAGIVHRDLKPANVFVLEGDALRLKLMDFGVAKLLASTDPSQTRRGQILGTPTHMAPEQVLGQVDRIVPQTDLYALGAILYEMLAECPVFCADNEVMLMLMHVSAPARPLTEYAPDVPDGVARLIESCLAKDPQARPPSAREFARAFAEAARHSASTAERRALVLDLLSEDDGLGMAATVATPAAPVVTAPTPVPAVESLDEAVAEAEAAVDKKVLGRLLAKMQRKGDFPAFVKNVTDISKKAEVHGDYSASHLSDSILKDYALTAKLLRVVNSGFAARFGGKIHSVQSAVVILGFDRVRSIALSISVYKVPSRREERPELRDSAIHALVSGEIARTLAIRAGVSDAERAQVAALFRDLGQHLVLHYLPEAHREIVEIAEHERVPAKSAAERVLGMSYAALGVAVAERWRLPESVVRSIAAPSIPPRRFTSDDERLGALAALSSELCATVAKAHLTDVEDEIAALLTRFEDLLKVHPKELPALLEAVRESISQRYAALVGTQAPKTAFFRGAALLDAGERPEPAAKLIARSIVPILTGPPAPHPDADAHVDPTRALPKVVKPLALGRLMAPSEPSPSALEDSEIGRRVAQLLAEGLPADELIDKALDLYVEVLGFRRAVLLVPSNDQRELGVRAVQGEDAELVARELSVPMGSQRSNDVFTAAWYSGRELAIEDAFDAKYTARIPRRYYEVIGSQVLVVHPCPGKSGSVGIVLADLDAADALPSPETRLATETLRAGIGTALARSHRVPSRPRT